MAEANAENNRSNQKKNTKGKTKSTENPAWYGNKAEEFAAKNIRERTFRVRLPTQFEAEDVLVSINGVLQKAEVEIETVSKQSTPGHRLIVT